MTVRTYVLMSREHTDVIVATLIAPSIAMVTVAIAYNREAMMMVLLQPPKLIGYRYFNSCISTESIT